MNPHSTLSALLPARVTAIYELVKAAGVDVSSWEINKKGNPLEDPRKNTYYVNQWSFGDDVGSVVFNIWHENLRVIDDRICCDDNMRKIECGRNEKHKVSEFDRRIKYSFKSGLNVRVIVLDKPSGNKSPNRLLDDEPWHVESYDSSGNFRLTRGAIQRDKNQYFDQFSIAERVRKVETSGSKFVRSSDVRDAVLRRAGGVCEYCGTSGFLTANGGFYLETHHVIPLSEDGADLPSNVVAICATDHRKAHHAENREEIRANFLAKLALLQKNAES
jgi:5-methylcytosine-specific restriction protein A